ncbi:Aste57867_23054 [Aphanomyces stellatus]|uniref:Aste57867_23054 protein n=1 Tax=Aphanomyces stellatus TaxID=120398 RepID=A0A485LMJ7_9STRA|nr:hypothetical protein As57867_022983 [Aphanomyces stellatus]VFT99702.1 Aste57867_23054 [Aphanomyces stellatus]
MPGEKQHAAASAHGARQRPSPRMDAVDAFLSAQNRSGSLGGVSSDLGNFSLEFEMTDTDDDDNERLSDDLDYDETEIERNTILIPDEDLDDLDGDLDDDDLDLLSPKDRRSATSDGGDSLNDSDSDYADDSTVGGGTGVEGDFLDEARDSFDARAFESVMNDLNLEFFDGGGGGSSDKELLTPPTTVIEDIHASVPSSVLSPDDEDIEAEIIESSLSSLRRLSIDPSQQATGALYKLIWEEGLLGLRLMMTTLFLPSVTKITGKSSMLGIHLVEVGDYLVKIGDQETHRMPFKDVIGLLKQVSKPCPLTFRRASDGPTAPMDVSQSGPDTVKTFPWKSSIAQRIAARIEELQAEEQAKEAQAPSVDLDNKYPVYWEDGPLGVSLVANKEVPYPQVTRITGKNRSAQVKDIVPGHYLVSIGNYDTASGTFNAAIKQLHDVVKPATLYFAPDMRQVSLRPDLGDDEYDQDWEKKQPLGFTLKPTPYGTVVADVGLAKTAKLKQMRDASSPSGPMIQVGDALIWVNDDCVEDMAFGDALKTLRQAKRPLHLRFRKEHVAMLKKSNSLPPPPPPKDMSPTNAAKRKELRELKKFDSAAAIAAAQAAQLHATSSQPPPTTSVPLSQKLSGAFKDLSPFGKKNNDASGKTDKASGDDASGRRQKKSKDQRGSVLGGGPPLMPPSSTSAASPAPTPEKHSRSTFWPSKDRHAAAAQPPVQAPPQSAPTTRVGAHSPASAAAPSSMGHARFAASPQKASTRHSPNAAFAIGPNDTEVKRTHSAHHNEPSSTGNGSSQQQPPLPSPLRRAPKDDSPPSSAAGPASTTTTNDDASKKNFPFEYEITWRAGEELGVTLKPHPETRRAVVARVSGANENAKRVALGDILLGANGIPLPPQQKFKDTLSQLSTMPKPTVLRFLRPARPVFPTSNRPQAPTPATSATSTEYELEWPDHSRLGLLFSPHPITNAPFVSRMESDGDHLKHVQLGDILVQLGTLDMRGLKFENCITALTVVSRPVVMRFRRGDVLVTPPASAPSQQPPPSSSSRHHHHGHHGHHSHPAAAHHQPPPHQQP